MITIAQRIEEIINRSPYLREGMSQRLVNISALARHLKPQVEAEMHRPITDTAVFMALQRYAAGLKPYTAANPGHFLGNLSLRSDLFEITIANSPSLMAGLSPLLADYQHDRSKLFVFTQGMYETTIIASRSLEPEITAALQEQTISSRLYDLTALSLQRLENHLEAVGVLMYPLRIIAWQGISVIEIVTTLNEIMIVIRDTDVDSAVIAVRQALVASTNKVW